MLDLDDSANRIEIGVDAPAGVSVRGFGGSDIVFGAGVADVMFGNTGVDYLVGLAGDDEIRGGRGGDFISGNQGNDTLLGERGGDIIFGGVGDDVLLGQDGDDFLAGDAGRDTLTGGEGADVFVLDVRHSVAEAAQADILTDFRLDDGDRFALTDGTAAVLSEADVTLTSSGGDTVISLTATGAVLGRVAGVAADALQNANAFTTVSASLDNTEAGATSLAAVPPGGVTIFGEVNDTDFVDFFRLEVTETSIVDLRLTGLSADADLTLYQDFNGDGETAADEFITASQLASIDDEAIENVTLDPGQYFVLVEQYSGSTTYSLNVSGVAGTVARDLAGDSVATARTLPISNVDLIELHDYVGGDDAIDTYRLDLPSQVYLDLFTDFQETDLDLTLWRDRNGNNALDAGETVSQATNNIRLESVASGTYYVNVTSPNGATPYLIVADAAAGSRVGTESFAPIFPGVTTTGTLTRQDTPDPFDPENFADAYILPELSPGVTVTVTQTSEDFDAYLTVVDLLSGETIAQGDDIDFEGGNTNAQVSFTTQAGVEYLVYASGVEAPGLGSYSLQAETAIETGDRRANDDSSARRNGTSDQLPPPLYNEQGGREDTGQKENRVIALTYSPLVGGAIGSIALDGLHQGGFGNCAYLAALGATFGKIADVTAANNARSSLLESAISVDGNHYTLRFYDFASGSPQTVTIDNQVVTQNGELFGADWSPEAVSPENAANQKTWGAVFERAYAKFRGQQTSRNGYDVAGNGDFPGGALKRVTGRNFVTLSAGTDGTYSIIDLAEDGSYTPSDTKLSQDNVFSRIQAALDGGQFVSAGTNDIKDEKIVNGHAYSVHNAFEVNGEKRILVRNPWGTDAQKGAVDDRNDGFVELTLAEFTRSFDSVALTK